MNRKLFTRILVATGGSPWSGRALEVALQMAKAYDLELVVVAVLTQALCAAKNSALGCGENDLTARGRPTIHAGRPG